MVETAPCTIETFQASDGYRWRYRRYAPATPARAHVVCIHGIQSHGGWYGHSCTRLSQMGFDVTFLDRRGAGLNEEARGDALSFRRLLDDLAEFLRSVRSSSPKLPIFLLAISWGGKPAVALQRRHPGLIDGLALICPGFCSRVHPPLRDRLGIAWARLIQPTRLFDVPLNEPELFTASPRWQQFIREDPLAIRQATARLLIESLRLDYYLRFAAAHVKMPVLMLLAEHDRVINNQATRKYIERFAAADKEVIEYLGAHHTLEFEPEPEQFIGDLQRWLSKHIR